MKLGFFPKLAWTGIKKNRRLYLPYILTCVGMVMMHFIVCSLVYSEPLRAMGGGTVLSFILSLGEWVIALFSLLFLFYTYSFLIRRRTKEFGMYNILGMNKGNICRIIAFEALIVSLIGIAGGLALGIAFSRLAELCLLNVLHYDVSSSLHISPDALKTTLLTYAVIFLLLFLNSLRLVGKSKPLEMLSSETVGERAPKANWFLALLGLVLLGLAYYMAVTIVSPIDALIWFFVAVIMVILASYLLFISGSVTLCRLLQKSKSYYYKARHFVSVSSMAYRMKRNGAGLASVCILSTMVLVTLSSTLCLYIGTEDSLRTRYPRDIELGIYYKSMDALDEKGRDSVRTLAHEAALSHGVSTDDVLDYTSATATAVRVGSRLVIDTDSLEGSTVNASAAIAVTVIPESEYAEMTGKPAVLGENEVYLNCYRMAYDESTISLDNTREYTVKGFVDDTPVNGSSSALIMPGIVIVVSDFDAFIEPLMDLNNSYGWGLVNLCWRYSFNTACDDDMHIALYHAIADGMAQLCGDGTLGSYYTDSITANRADFYGTYGGLLFIGIVLSLVFLCAAVLIIYYKQISEGYEDQSRFEIMQNVGMTDDDIKRSINSQVLIVFFTPLIVAGMHTLFAFPLVYKMLMLFNMVNMNLLVMVTFGAILIFAAFYGVVYKLTSNAYFSIVSGGRPRE